MKLCATKQHFMYRNSNYRMICVQILKPWSLIHFKCASMRPLQFSSPFSTMLESTTVKWMRWLQIDEARQRTANTHQASRAFFVSGHAQQALHFGFSPVLDVAGASADTVGAAALPSWLPIVVYSFVMSTQFHWKRDRFSVKFTPKGIILGTNTAQGFVQGLCTVNGAIVVCAIAYISVLHCEIGVS